MNKYKRAGGGHWIYWAGMHASTFVRLPRVLFWTMALASRLRLLPEEEDEEEEAEYEEEEETCPICLAHASDLFCPVRAADGRVYEAESLQRWLHECDSTGKERSVVPTVVLDSVRFVNASRQRGRALPSASTDDDAGRKKGGEGGEGGGRRSFPLLPSSPERPRPESVDACTQTPLCCWSSVLVRSAVRIPSAGSAFETVSSSS